MGRKTKKRKSGRRLQRGKYVRGTNNMKIAAAYTEGLTAGETKEFFEGIPNRASIGEIRERFRRIKAKRKKK